MIDTDFDLLCDSVNPAEAKRLRKILAEWCSGDENSFPVQLALLTKAQWRAIGRLPHILRDSQKDWQRDQASHRARFSEQFNSAMDDARRLASDSKKLLDTVQADHRRQIAAQSKTTVEAIDERLKQYDMTVSGYNDVIHGIATQICSKARELEAVARKIQNDLDQGGLVVWERGEAGCLLPIFLSRSRCWLPSIRFLVPAQARAAWNSDKVTGQNALCG